MNRESARDRIGRLLKRLHQLGAPGWKRLALRIGVPVAVFAVLVVAPGYVASRPAFTQRYAKMDGRYQSWSRSVHAKVACSRCHVDPSRAAQAAYAARMVGEFYLSVFSPSRDPKLFAEPTNAACSDCHMDLRTVSPKGDLNIPHRAHVTVLRMKCVECHGYLVHKKTPAGKTTPRMADCLKCHDGRKAKDECSACHTDKLEPLTHRTPQWLVDHPAEAKANAAACNKCHDWTARWCVDCHEKRPRSHTTEWRSQHRVKVESHRNCEACHTGSFCDRCHGEVPQLGFDPALKLVE